MTSQPADSNVINEDRRAIRQAALDYVEGWYEGNAERMGRSLHPELVKRALKDDSSDGRTYLNHLSREDMIAATQAGEGTHVPEDQRAYEITILDIYEEIATVKAVNPDWIDYLHLVKLEGKWVILNVLYTANRTRP